MIPVTNYDSISVSPFIIPTFHEVMCWNALRGSSSCFTVATLFSVPSKG